MIVSFRVGNFLSFGEEQEISFEAGNDPYGDDETFQVGDTKILKTVSVFGPNGSGKTNLVLALAYALNLIGMKDWGYNCFLKSSETHRLNGDVSHFADCSISRFEFAVSDSDGKRYRYGFEYDSSKKEVISERFTDMDDGAILFEREGLHCICTGTSG